MSTNPKVYLCTTCSNAHAALPFGGWCDRCRNQNIRAARVCENCGQWEWASFDERGRIQFRCFNECAARGFVT